MTNTHNHAYELMEKLASNHHQMMYGRTMKKWVPRVIQMYAFNTILAELSALRMQMQNLENMIQVNA